MNSSIQGRANMILNPSLGKKQNLNEKQMKNIRMVLQRCNCQPQNKTFYYNIASKQSNWGFSENQRLILLNVEQMTFGYLSKVPQGYLPFDRYEQFMANKQKQKIQLKQATNFKCIPIKGKISSMSIQWEDRDKKKHNWNFILGSSKIMNEWVGLINSIVKNSYSKQNYDKIANQNTSNKNSQLISYNQPPKNTQINKNNQPLTGNNRQNIPGQNNSINKVNNQNNQRSQINQNGNYIENRMSKVPSFGNERQSLINQTEVNNRITNEPSSFEPQSRNLAKNMKNNNNDLVNNSKVLPQSQIQQNQSNIHMPRLGEYKRPSQQRIDLQINGKNHDYYGYKGLTSQSMPEETNKSANQLGYAFNKKSTHKILDLSKENQNQFSSIQYKNNSQNQPSYYKDINSYVEPPNSINTQYEQLHSRQTDYHPTPNIQNVYLSENTGLNPQKSVEPGDFVEELKKFRKRNPEKFDLTNQLSNKKFQKYVSPQYQNSHELAHKNIKHQPLQFKNSRENLNENSRQNLNNISSSKRSFNYFNKGHSLKQQQMNLNQVEENRNFVRSQTKKSGLGFTVEGQPFLQQNNSIGTRSKSNVIIPQSGINNQNYSNDQIQLYKPTTSFPESSKNLTKIRSDFLERQSQDPSYKMYPQSSKNKSKFIKNDQVLQKNQSRAKQNFNSSENYNQKEESNRNYAIDKIRQNSIKNLQKVGQKLTSKSTTKQTNIWNQIWLQTSNPNKKVQIHEQFIYFAQGLVKQIIEELPFSPSHRKHQPIDTKQNVHTFSISNILISMHFFENNESINTSRQNINEDAPVIYDQVTYDELKRQFYNYNLIIGVTNNQGFIKVPLCCYFQYKGILVLCKAHVPEKYREIQPYEYKNEFEALQNIIKVRFLFGIFNIYECTPYRGGQGKFILLWNLKNLIPGIPNALKNQSSYFRKQFLLQYDEILQDLETSSEAHAFTLGHIIPNLLVRLQSLETQIVHSKDLIREMHKVGLSLSYLPNLFQQTNSVYLKKIFISEIVSCIFTEIIRSELNHAYAILPSQNLQNISTNAINDIIIDCAHVLINEFFSYSLKAENIWKIIVHEASKKYHIIVSKQEIIPGYLLSAIIMKNNISCNFKQKSFLRSKTFFIHENVIPRQIFQNFQILTRRYDMESICSTYSKCKQILEQEEQSNQNYEHLAMILNLKSRNGFSNYYEPIIEPLKAYLCNYIPYNQEAEYYKIDLYEYLYTQPLTANSIKSSFLAIKWLIKNNQIEKANQIFQIKFHELSFWLGEYNPSITQFYDFFSMYYASIGEYEESICLAKSSLINVHKILGQQALPIADKHYQLGNIYFKTGRKNQALKEYNKTKQVLKNHEKTTIPEFGIILLKISLLSLNFGELTDCIENSIEAERIFQNNGGNENEQIQCFQILARVYEITKKHQDNNNLIEACAKTFNLTQNPKILERMLKIVMLPKLCSISTQQQKSLTQILTKLQEQTRNSYQQAFNFLHKKAEKGNLKKKIYLFLQNIVHLSDQINRRDLMRKHISLTSQSGGEAEQMLNILEAMGIMIGFNFMIGAMKDTYYE